MRSGMVFDIKEFAVHDGPGIRTTVFLKGCPLRCAWCHNPEGMDAEAQTMTGPTGERVVGERYTSEALAGILNGQAGILRANEGGVTFSGGEPLAQAAFVAEVIDRLDRVHVLLDTSGYGAPEAFGMLVERADLVYFDVKLVDPAAHRRWTGCDNAPILANLDWLAGADTPFVVRVPLVPGVTDTDVNLRAIARRVRGLAGLVRVDLLPYNRAAGGKYQACGMTFEPEWDESRPVNANTTIFEQAGLAVRVT